MESEFVSSATGCVYANLPNCPLQQRAKAALARHETKVISVSADEYSRRLLKPNDVIAWVLSRVGPTEQAAFCDPSCFAPPILGLIDVESLPASTATGLAKSGWVFVHPSSTDPEFDSALSRLVAEGEFRRELRRKIDELAIARSTLSAAEVDVMEMVIQGTLNKQIATRLRVSIRTVEQRRQRVFRKMKVVNAVELAAKLGEVDAFLRIDARHGQEPLLSGQHDFVQLIGEPGVDQNESPPVEL